MAAQQASCRNAGSANGVDQPSADIASLPRPLAVQLDKGPPPFKREHIGTWAAEAVAAGPDPMIRTSQGCCAASSTEYMNRRAPREGDTIATSRQGLHIRREWADVSSRNQ